VGLFRRKQETLNAQLLREAGLDPSAEPAVTSAPAESEAPAEPLEVPFKFEPTKPVHTHNALASGPLEWDAVGTVKTVLAGDQIQFRTLPDGDIIVDIGEGDLSPLADSIEKKIDPPYKAVASRQTNELWGVAAKRIQVAKVELAEGERIELTVNDGDQEVRMDGRPSDAEVPELVALGEKVAADYCVEAERIDGDFWEVKVSPL
jgi:hypothetical protein